MKKKEQPEKIINFNRILRKRSEKLKSMNNKKQKDPTMIISITSGKGGVGKTNIVANLGYALGNAGKKVLIFDADMGLGNLDILLGIAPQYNLSHVIKGEKTVSEIIVDGPGNLKIMPASSGVQEMTNLTMDQRQDLLREMGAVIGEYDVLLIDTAAGISSNVLYFNASAHQIMVVVTPEPTSITDAYALMKVLSMKYGEKQFNLLVNSAASEGEANDVFRQLNLVAQRFLDIDIEYFGSILLDENIKKGVKKQRVVSEMAPVSKASRNFATLARKISELPPPETATWEVNLFGKDKFINQAD